jgi:hypothetical protein
MDESTPSSIPSPRTRTRENGDEYERNQSRNDEKNARRCRSCIVRNGHYCFCWSDTGGIRNCHPAHPATAIPMRTSLSGLFLGGPVSGRSSEKNTEIPQPATTRPSNAIPRYSHVDFLPRCFVPHAEQTYPGFRENEFGGSGSRFEFPHFEQNPICNLVSCSLIQFSRFPCVSCRKNSCKVRGLGGWEPFK